MEDAERLNWSWIKRRWWELRIGHTQYLAFFLSFSNFLLIAYNFLVTNLIDINLLFFAIFAISCYVPLSIYVGHLHKKKQLETDVNVQFKPILDRLDKIMEIIQDG